MVCSDGLFALKLIKVRTSLDEKNEQNSGLDFLSLLDVKNTRVSLSCLCKNSIVSLSQQKDIKRKKISARFS